MEPVRNYGKLFWRQNRMSKMADVVYNDQAPERGNQGTEKATEISGSSTARLMITKIVNENFKSYAGTQELGPFHKVCIANRVFFDWLVVFISEADHSILIIKLFCPSKVSLLLSHSFEILFFLRISLPLLAPMEAENRTLLMRCCSCLVTARKWFAQRKFHNWYTTQKTIKMSRAAQLPFIFKKSLIW